MTIKIKAKENILGVIKKGETRDVANNFGLLMVKQGRAELIDFYGSEYVLQNVKEQERRKKVIESVGIKYKTSYTPLQIVEIIEKLKNENRKTNKNTIVFRKRS